MTREEAMKWLKHCAFSICEECEHENMPIEWCDQKMREAVTAIEKAEPIKGGDAEMRNDTTHIIEPYMQQRPSNGADLISRADAIEAVRKKLQDWGGYAFEDYRRGLYEAQDIIEALPSADKPSKVIATVKVDTDEVIERIKEEYDIGRPHGEWIHDGQNFKGGLDWCHCSVCGQKTSANGLSMYHFCPNCGADMRGDTNND